MKEKVAAFIAAYRALCEAHDLYIATDYDGEMGVEEGAPLDFMQDIGDWTYTPPTPEELLALAEREARRLEAMPALERERLRRQRELHEQMRQSACADLMTLPAYQELQRLIDADAAKQRSEQLRVSTDPTDPAYIDDRPRRVKSNDVEITDWAVADEFRRCVITKDGRVINGAVWIERLAAEPEAEVQVASTTLPIHAGFTGMFVNVPDVSPVPMPIAELPNVTEEAFKGKPVPKAKKRRR